MPSHEATDFEKNEIDNPSLINLFESVQPTSVSSAATTEEKNRSFRFCVDYRNLRAVTLATSYVFQEWIAASTFLKRWKYFQPYMLKKGNWWIEVDSFDRGKTEFTSKHGLFQLARKTFGLKSALLHSNGYAMLYYSAFNGSLHWVILKIL